MTDEILAVILLLQGGVPSPDLISDWKLSRYAAGKIEDSVGGIILTASSAAGPFTFPAGNSALMTACPWAYSGGNPIANLPLAQIEAAVDNQKSFAGGKEIAVYSVAQLPVPANRISRIGGGVDKWGGIMVDGGQLIVDGNRIFTGV